MREVPGILSSQRVKHSVTTVVDVLSGSQSDIGERLAGILGTGDVGHSLFESMVRTIRVQYG